VPGDAAMTPKGMARAGGFLVHAGSFGITVLIWRWVAQAHPTPAGSAVLIVAPVLLVFPVVWAGRRLLGARPSAEHVARITAFVHFVLMILFGTAVVEALKTGREWPGGSIPVPAGIGLVLLWLTGLATALTVVNLAIRGLGAPFAIALSRRLATDWLYRWTRNPMVLAVLAWLLSFGVWIRSGLFLLWVLLLVTPAWLVFLKAYEERELEIRFGEPYLDYKARTSMLLPRKPKRQGSSARVSGASLRPLR
jgi:protein-S-isoprenylcysteine O-methyltransferase Ste14